jgi:hypothetical protein
MIYTKLHYVVLFWFVISCSLVAGYLHSSACEKKILVPTYQPARWHRPGDRSMTRYHCENLKSYYCGMFAQSKNCIARRDNHLLENGCSYATIPEPSLSNLPCSCNNGGTVASGVFSAFLAKAIYNEDQTPL